MNKINCDKIKIYCENIIEIAVIFDSNFDILKGFEGINKFSSEDICNVNKTIKAAKDLESLDLDSLVNFSDITSSQFINFINNSISEINPNEYLISKSYQDSFVELFTKIKNKQLSVWEGYKKKEYEFKNFSNIINQYINRVKEFINQLGLIKKLEIPSNIVIVGSNGSGKSSLARQFKKMSSSAVTLLTAQRLLYYKRSNSILDTGEELNELIEFQGKDKYSNDSEYSRLLNSDMNILMTALISEHYNEACKAYDGTGDICETKLKKLTKIWNELNTHRTLKIDKLPPYIIYGNDIEYTFNELSDGEKAIFYYIGHVISARENSYIIIDEPENHLHPSICNKVWDILEKTREDCKFVYITHNLEFASSRNSTILWNKEFIPPYDWNFDILEKNNFLPEHLMLEILGTKKKVCFCEGEQSSLDIKLYTVLFPELTIIPAKGHRDVISCVDAINKQFDGFLPKTIGIIDGDYHNTEQIKKWEEKQVFSLAVNEVENILVDEEVLNYAISCSGAEKEDLDEYFKLFWLKFSNNKEEQVVKYIKEYVHYMFEEKKFTKNTIEELKDELDNLLSIVDIDSLYDEKFSQLKTWENNKDYLSAIKFVDFKKELINGCTKKISPNYQKRILNMIKNNDKLKKIIRDKYFNSDIFKENM